MQFGNIMKGGTGQRKEGATENREGERREEKMKGGGRGRLCPFFDCKPVLLGPN